MSIFGATEKAVLLIEGMSCHHCVKEVTDGINELRGIKKVSVSLTNNNAEISFDTKKISLDEIKKAVNEAGYTVV